MMMMEGRNSIRFFFLGIYKSEVFFSLCLEYYIQYTKNTFPIKICRTLLWNEYKLVNSKHLCKKRLFFPLLFVMCDLSWGKFGDIFRNFFFFLKALKPENGYDIHMRTICWKWFSLRTCETNCNALWYCGPTKSVY